MDTKQEYIQVHQLLAHIRFEMLEEWNLPARIQDLDRYKQVGITSLDMNAEINTQREAILTLAKDLYEILEPPSGQTTLNQSEWERPTQKTRAYDVESNTLGSMRTGATASSRMPPVGRTVDVPEQYRKEVQEPSVDNETVTRTLKNVATREERGTAGAEEPQKNPATARTS
jgi:hypothetical protein